MQQIYAKEFTTKHDWVWKGIHRELLKKCKFDKSEQMLHAQPGICPKKNETRQILWDFEIQTDHLISARRLHLQIVTKKKRRTCWVVDIAVPADHRVKLKENEMRDKYLDLAKDLKKKKLEYEGDGDIRCN